MKKLGTRRRPARVLSLGRIVLASLGLVLPASARSQLQVVVTPDPNGIGDFVDIQQAITNVAGNPGGGTVTIMPGIYRPTGATEIRIAPPPIPIPPLVIQGGGAYPSQAVLDSEGTTMLPVITVETGWDDNLVIRNLRIQRGGYDHHTAPPGGGIRIEGSSPLISGNEILCNHSNSGGGIACVPGTPNGGVAIGSFPVISDNLIALNTTKSGSGGGLYYESSGGELRNNIIKDNHASNDGGGLFAVGSTLDMTRNVFDANNGANRGGGIYAGSTVATFAGNIIRGNESSCGGGVYVSQSSSTVLRSNLVVENLAYGDSGGGLYLDSSDVLVMHQTLSGNNAAFDGGGIFLGGSIVSLHNSIVWGNTAGFSDPEIGGSAQSLTTSHCLIGGTINPSFAPAPNPLPFDWRQDYHITWDSPCRNAGAVIGDPALNGEWDIDGDPRIPLCANEGKNPHDSAPDIGADEFFTTIYVEEDETPSYTEAEVILQDPIRIVIAGPPGWLPFLGWSSSLTTPVWLPFCNTFWHLDGAAPGADLVELIPIPPSGLLEIPLQVPVGPALTNLQVVLVGPTPPHFLIASTVEPFLILPSSEIHPTSCDELDVEITPIVSGSGRDL